MEPTLVFQHLVQRDMDEVLRYYQSEAGIWWPTASLNRFSKSWTGRDAVRNIFIPFPAD